MSIISDWDGSYFLSSFKTDSTTREYAVKEVACREACILASYRGYYYILEERRVGRGLRGRIARRTSLWISFLERTPLRATVAKDEGIQGSSCDNKNT